jgi:hypothetical protein
MTVTLIRALLSLVQNSDARSVFVTPHVLDLSHLNAVLEQEQAGGGGAVTEGEDVALLIAAVALDMRVVLAACADDVAGMLTYADGC